MHYVNGPILLRKNWAVVVEMDLKWMTWKYHMADCKISDCPEESKYPTHFTKWKPAFAPKKHCGISSKEHNYGNLC